MPKKNTSQKASAAGYSRGYYHAQAGKAPAPIESFPSAEYAEGYEKGYSAAQHSRDNPRKPKTHAENIAYITGYNAGRRRSPIPDEWADDPNYQAGHSAGMAAPEIRRKTEIPAPGPDPIRTKTYWRGYHIGYKEGQRGKPLRQFEKGLDYQEGYSSGHESGARNPL